MIITALSTGLPCAHIAQECDLFPICVLYFKTEVAAHLIVSGMKNNEMLP